MKIKQIFFFGLWLLSTHLNCQNTNSRTGILILGSNNLTILDERIDSGYKLFKLIENVDYIIVSGGCNAHNSDICEATEMANLLENKGIPKKLIFKEEQSQNTFQNYCYSRKLKNQEGHQIIQPGDNLYVVSNHWHAIPVAARFRKYDSVNAQYYIVGKIIPKSTDRVNYTEIYSKKKSECICEF